MTKSKLAGVFLFLAVTVSCLPTPACAQEPYEARFPAFEATALTPVPDAQPVPAFLQERAWAEAQRLLALRGLGPPAGFVPPETLRVRVSYNAPVQDRAGMLFGMYYATRYVSPTGTMEIAERVVVFTGEDCLVHEILVHEYLHALHERLAHINPDFNTVDREGFVAVLYPPREDFPACPATF